MSASHEKPDLRKASQIVPDHERRRKTKFLIVLALIPLGLLLLRVLASLVEFIPFVGSFLAGFEGVAAFFLAIVLGAFSATAIESLDPATPSRRMLVLAFSFAICSLMFATPYMVGYYKAPLKIGRAAAAEQVDLTYAQASELFRSDLREQTSSDGIPSYAIYVERQQIASGSVVTYAGEQMEGVEDPVSLVFAVFNILLSAAPVLLTWIFAVQLGWVREAGHVGLVYWYLVSLALWFLAYRWNLPELPAGAAGRSSAAPVLPEEPASLKNGSKPSSPFLWFMIAAIVIGALLGGVILLLQHATGEISRNQDQMESAANAQAPMSTAGNPSNWTVTLSGLGPIRVGRSRQALEADIGSRLTESSKHKSGTAWLRLTGLSDATVALAADRVRAVKITGSWRTRSGLKVGDPEAEILRLYGDKVAPRQAATGAGSVYEFVPRDSQDAHLRVFFTAAGDRVSAICAGELEASAELCGVDVAWMSSDRDGTLSR